MAGDTPAEIVTGGKVGAQRRARAHEAGVSPSTAGDDGVRRLIGKLPSV